MLLKGGFLEEGGSVWMGLSVVTHSLTQDLEASWGVPQLGQDLVTDLKTLCEKII